MGDYGDFDDLLTEDQRAELNDNEFVTVDDKLKLHEGYEYEGGSYLVVTEDSWWFRSYQDRTTILTAAMSFDLLQQVL